MTNSPKKPITLLVKEFDENIVNIINTSKLPMWKVRDELEKIMKSVYGACAEEEKREIEQYNQEMIKHTTELENTENKTNTQE